MLLDKVTSDFVEIGKKHVTLDEGCKKDIIKWAKSGHNMDDLLSFEEIEKCKDNNALNLVCYLINCYFCFLIFYIDDQNLNS